VRAATADKSMLKIAVLLLSVRSSHSCVCGSENPICESESGGWCTEADGSLPGWGVCGGRFGTSCSRSYALCPDIASVTVAGVTYTEEPYGTYTPLTQNGCHSGPKEMPTFRNNEAASEYLYQCVTEGDDDYGYWLTAMSMFYDGTSCTGGTRVTDYMNMASCPSAGSPSCIVSTTGGTSNFGCSGEVHGSDQYSLTGRNVNGRDIYQQDGYISVFLWMCSSGRWVRGVNMDPQRWGCASSTIDVPLYSLCPYAGSIVGAPPSPPIGVGTATSPPSPLPPPPPPPSSSPPPPSSSPPPPSSSPPPPSAIMCTAYVPGTATGGSCSQITINGVTSCTPTGCRSGCPGYRPDGYEQVHCSPPPPPSSSPPPLSSSPPPPRPTTGATQSPNPPIGVGTATWSAGGGSSSSNTPASVGDICSAVKQVLPSQCICRATSANTGLYAECQESLPLGLGNVGVQVEIEPCEADGAYAALSYQLGGGWVSAQRVQSGGAPARIQIPGLAYFGAGLYLEVRLTGTLSDLEIHLLLSLCFTSDSCNGNIMGVGSAVAAAGFPIKVLEFDDLPFDDYCPAASDNNIIIYAAAAGGAAVIAVLVGTLCWMKKRGAQKQAQGQAAIPAAIEINMAEGPPVSSGNSATKPKAQYVAETI